jgi:hypothetical protein
MAANDIEKVLTVLQGIGSGDADLASRHINPIPPQEEWKNNNGVL